MYLLFSHVQNINCQSSLKSSAVVNRVQQTKCVTEPQSMPDHD